MDTRMSGQEASAVEWAWSNYCLTTISDSQLVVMWAILIHSVARTLDVASSFFSAQPIIFFSSERKLADDGM